MQQTTATIGQRLVIPQLKIPQLNLGQQQLPNTAEALAAQEAQNRAADAHNEFLLNEIKRRREQQAMAAGGQLEGTLGGGGGFTIPKLRAASGEALEEPHLNIPLLNKLRSQNNSLTAVTSQVQQLKLTTATATATDQLIDLTSAVIAVAKDAPPREAASKMMSRRATQITEHFDIPFIGCDNLRSRLNAGILSKKTQDDNESPPLREIEEKSSIIGMFMDRSVGYPQPRQPQLKYAVSQLERQHLKMCQRIDYGSNLNRFLFDTPSPDERIKEALQKSWRVSRT
ncbi:hypothetical protein KR044_006346 [Drosophila immigrans]|nr:hypothetical protein KR044_006346 [Drosophila immigrans]